MTPRAEVVELAVDGLEVLVVDVADAPLVSAALTRAEREVAALAAAGHSDREIAGIRRTSVRTVGHQLASVYRKLGIASRFELARRAERVPEDHA